MTAKPSTPPAFERVDDRVALRPLAADGIDLDRHHVAARRGEAQRLDPRAGAQVEAATGSRRSRAHRERERLGAVLHRRARRRRKQQDVTEHRQRDASGGDGVAGATKQPRVDERVDLGCERQRRASDRTLEPPQLEHRARDRSVLFESRSEVPAPQIQRAERRMRVYVSRAKQQVRNRAQRLARTVAVTVVHWQYEPPGL